MIASFWGKEAKGLYKSSDEGETWSPIPVNRPGYQWGTTMIRFAGTRGTIFAAGVVGSSIVCSSNDGETWATHC